MSPSISRRAVTIGATALSALLVALAVASQATAATYYACVKKNGLAHIYTQKPKCKKGESKLSWNNVGPAGRNGSNGTNGLNGASGKNGTNGTNGTNGVDGRDLISQTPLASGQSESGAFAIGTAGGTSGFASTGISFAQPLAAPLGNGHVVDNAPGTTSSNCPGKGKASPGFACIYEAERASLTFLEGFGFAGSGESNAAQTYGFSVYYTVGGAGFVDGTWTVTAP
jgi:hypothetical protein